MTDLQLGDHTLDALRLLRQLLSLVRFGLALDGTLQGHDSVLGVDVDLQGTHLRVGEQL